jgi:hypothetical protein
MNNTSKKQPQHIKKTTTQQQPQKTTTLLINIQDCYRIAKLTHDFELNNNNSEYRNSRTIQIYAPNGTMKTSFTKCFKDFKKGKESKEQISKQDGIFSMHIDGKDITKEQISIVESYVDDYESSHIQRLLLNKDLQTKYNNINEKIATAQNKLETTINSIAKINIFTILENLEGEINYEKLNKLKPNIAGLANIKNKDIADKYSLLDYKILFSPQALDVLNNTDIKEHLKKYFTTYMEFVKNSKIYRLEGGFVFDHINANNIKEQLDNNKFFRAKHKVVLSINKGNNDDNKEQTCDSEDFAKLIQEEQYKINNDKGLKDIWSGVEKSFSKNIDARKWPEYIKNNIWLVDDLDNVDALRKKVICAYCVKVKKDYDEYLKVYEDNEKDIANIKTQARKDTAKWQECIEEFKNRFLYLPYQVKIENPEDCVLGIELPKLSYKPDNSIEDNSIEDKSMDADKSIDVNYMKKNILSEAEKRTLYLLHIIFDLKNLEQTKGEKQLLIIDDIIDSFDYKNKHAILEYIYDATAHGNIYLIMLTHSFDFYSKIASLFQLRFGYIAEKDQNRNIKLIKYNNTPNSDNISNHNISSDNISNNKIAKENTFDVKSWLKIKDAKDFIASIPLIRNLCEYQGDKGENSLYKKLSNILHYSIDNTKEITIKDLHVDIKRYLDLGKQHAIDNIKGLEGKDGLTFYQLVKQVAEEICDSNKDCNGNKNKYQHMNLQDKVILAIALRLSMEEKLVKYLSQSKDLINQNNKGKNEEEYNNIKHNQTRKLINEFKKHNKQIPQQTKVLLDMINILSSNHIHLNSFAFEPLLDILGYELIDKYNKINELNLLQQPTL